MAALNTELSFQLVAAHNRMYQISSNQQSFCVIIALSFHFIHRLVGF